MKRFLALLSFAFVCVLSPAQSPQPAGDPIADQLFPPELVMQFHQEINLTAEQSKALKDEIQKAQARFLDMQWDMQAEQEKLVLLLKAQPVSESAVLTQVDKLLDREREIKRTQIALLVRIKNQLTPAQQNKLNELRHKSS